MENQTIARSIPRIGEQAPDFKSLTTTGEIQFSEYNKGSWVVLFSHPADFTPVCTTEMMAFANEQKFFDEHNTKLMGLSIDSIHAHLGWVNNVYQNTGVLFEFPIIADLDMSVSKLYGMLHPGESSTAAVRAVFFIDPAGKIRLIMYYPLNIGRNMEEIKRALIALQASDEHKVALPIDWVPGQKGIVSAPKTVNQMLERLTDTEHEKIDFYLMKKELK